MGRAFWAAGGFIDDGMPWKDDTFLQRCEWLIKDENGILLVAEEGGMLHGSIAGVVQPMLFNEDLSELRELWWWVNPDSRGLTGMRLMNHFRILAGMRGCLAMVVSTSKANNEEKLGRVYERMGFHRIHSDYLMEVSQCQGR